ncbi:2731_t:CDS:1 [Funneliformis geosporum]|uniref:600_t:CDS:1 n=1 Tax=Funneliformis geosporum TaxID=1117311 RepID=A0A9W4X0G4_9GLOM|nr:2731_t:CDS:1 [Funneliformis geosporum]CAI2177268.1 600_t:CDS:1 [Funneliformis geosporum]
MSLYWFETRFDRKLAPYPSPKLSQKSKTDGPTGQKLISQSEIVDHIIANNIDTGTLAKIERYISIPLKTLITPRLGNRRKTCNSIPRPQNNFVLYRRNLHAIISNEQGSATAKNFKVVSNLAAKKWADESNEIKQLFEIIADCAKKVHDYTYPEYVYQPRISGKTSMKFRPIINGEPFVEEKKPQRKTVVPSLLLSTFAVAKPGTNNKKKEDSKNKRQVIDLTLQERKAEMNSKEKNMIDLSVKERQIETIDSTLQKQMIDLNLAKQETVESSKGQMMDSSSLEQTMNSNERNSSSLKQMIDLNVPKQEEIVNSGVQQMKIDSNSHENTTNNQQPTQQPEQQRRRQAPFANLLQPIDITITSSFMHSAYDKQIVSLFNGYASL